MPTIQIVASGSFSKLETFLAKMKRGQLWDVLDHFGRMGDDALANDTPVESGLTARSWGHEIEVSGGQARISWFNTNQPGGFPLAVMLQFGHGTGTGGYVVGRDYINPAMQSIFDNIADQVWKEVTSA